jgi:hypothetical protein
MGIGFGFKVMPGVRVRVSSRGVRTSVGPRAARVHVGGGRTTLSSGVGPVTVWSAGGRRKTSSRSGTRASYGPSPAQLQRQTTAIARAQAAEDKLARIRELIDLQRDLVSAHLERFVDTSRPIVDAPTWVHPQQYLLEAEQRHLSGVGRFDRSGRDAARRAALAEAEQAATNYNGRLQSEHASLQAQADHWWAALVGNDEATVIDTANAAFADNASTAAALSVDGLALAVLMIQPTADDLGDQKAALTPGGKPTVTRMTKTEQRQLWTACTLSRAVATISEALAVAPGIQRVNIAVVSQRLASSTHYSLILAGEAPRNLFRSAQWPTHINTSDLARAGNFVFDLDRFGALSEIPTDNDPHLHALVDGINGVIDQDNSEAAVASIEPQGALAASSPVTTTYAPSINRVRPAPTMRTIETRAEPSAAPEGKPFVLWGRSGYGNTEVKGTEHRQDAILSLLPRRELKNGADLDTTAQLIPEPTNPFDANAVGCWVQGRLIGYLPRDEAARYAATLAQFVRSGRLPTASVHLWAREFEDYDYENGRETRKKRYFTSARVGLAEPELLGPINLAPPKPRAELPDGGAAKVTGTQDNLPHLLAVLAGRPTAWAYGVLEPTTITGPRSAKTVVRVLINGQSAGTLSSQMSTTYLPIVEPLTDAGCRATVRVLLKGSPVSVAATVYAARAHEIPHDWFENLRNDLGISLRSA